MSQRYRIEGYSLRAADRAVIARWCGQVVPPIGDFALDLTRSGWERLQVLLEILGH